MKKAFILLIVFSLSVHRVYAEESCSIYRIALDSLYKSELNILVPEHDQAKIDPHSADDIRNEGLIEMQAPYMIFIEKELINFNGHWAKPWIQKIIDKKEKLQQQEFYGKDQDLKLRCEDFGANFCYEIISSRQSDTFNYSSTAFCPAKETVFLYKKKIKWSQVVFSDQQNFAVVYCEVKERRGRGDEVIWVFTLVRENGVWAIYSCDRSRS